MALSTAAVETMVAVSMEALETNVPVAPPVAAGAPVTNTVSVTVTVPQANPAVDVAGTALAGVALSMKTEELGVEDSMNTEELGVDDSMMIEEDGVDDSMKMELLGVADSIKTDVEEVGVSRKTELEGVGVSMETGASELTGPASTVEAAPRARRTWTGASFIILKDVEKAVSEYTKEG